MKNENLCAFDPSPVNLRYIAALRGIAPSKASTPFVYVQTGVFDPEDLMGLAASNPEGRFYGLLENVVLSEKAQQTANDRNLANMTFGNPSSEIPVAAHYLCCDASARILSEEERNVLFEKAERLLAPGGLFCLRYKTCETEESLLRFLIDEYARDLSDAQRTSFMSALRIAGEGFWARHPDLLKSFEKALADGNPDALGLRKPQVSGSFDVLAGLLPRNFAYVGNARPGDNYVELSVPVKAQEALLSFKDLLFYEPIKDFALARLVREDVWARMPVSQSSDGAELFDAFTFGITIPKEKIPCKIETCGGKEIDLQTPLFKSLIDLMEILPLGVGDFLAHPAGAGHDAGEVLFSIQILVAAGIAQPMRSRYTVREEAEARLVPDFKTSRYLNSITVATPTVKIASPVAGRSIALSARAALVLQAISRVGVAQSSGALFMELEQLSKNRPGLAAEIMDHAVPTPETAEAMLKGVIDREITRWYAYGLMAA